MILLVPLQTSTGGSPSIVALTLVGLLITVLLSLVVAYLIIRGYSQNRNRARLYLAIGLLFLTTGPILSQFVLTNLGVVPNLRSAIANISKLSGLGAMVYAIYSVSQSTNNTQQRQTNSRNHNSTQTERDNS
jgi:hypothetical protein